MLWRDTHKVNKWECMTRGKNNFKWSWRFSSRTGYPLLCRYWLTSDILHVSFQITTTKKIWQQTCICTVCVWAHVCVYAIHWHNGFYSSKLGISLWFIGFYAVERVIRILHWQHHFLKRNQSVELFHDSN